MAWTATPSAFQGSGMHKRTRPAGSDVAPRTCIGRQHKTNVTSGQRLRRINQKFPAGPKACPRTRKSKLPPSPQGDEATPYHSPKVQGRGRPHNDLETQRNINRTYKTINDETKKPMGSRTFCSDIKCINKNRKHQSSKTTITR